jgi:O-antigen/teichoic acid export membrane protein
VVLPFLARAFTPQDYGLFSQVWVTVAWLAALVSVSLEHGVVRAVAGEESLAEQSTAVWSSLAVTTLLAFALVALVSAAGATSAAGLLLGEGRWQGEALLAVVLAAESALITVGLAFMQARQETVLLAVLQVLRTALTASAMVFVAWTTQRPSSTLVAAGVSEGVAALVVLICLVVRVGRPRFSSGFVRGALAFCMPLAAANALFALVNAIPRYVLAHAAGLAAVGVYSMTAAILAPLGQLATPLQYVSYPEATRLWKMGQPSAARETVWTIASAYVLLAASVLACIAGLSAPLVALVASRQYLPTAAMTLAVGAGVVCTGSLRLISLQGLMKGTSMPSLFALLAGCVATLASALALVPAARATGAGLAYAVGNAVALLVVVVLLWDRGTGEQVRRWGLIVFRAGLASAIVLYGLRHVRPSGALTLAFAGLGAWGLFVTVCALLGGGRDGRVLFAVLLRRPAQGGSSS